MYVTQCPGQAPRYLWRRAGALVLGGDSARDGQLVEALPGQGGGKQLDEDAAQRPHVRLLRDVLRALLE